MSIKNHGIKIFTITGRKEKEKRKKRDTEEKWK